MTTAAAVTSDMVIKDCARSMFDQPIIENIIRGKLVEAMVNLALRDTGPWFPCDIVCLE